MGYSSAQFIGRSSALKAFQNMNCANWSVLQGKQFLFKYEGTDINEATSQLSELLDMIANSSGSEAIYTLRVYEYDAPAKGAKAAKRKIYESTPYDGSYNFKLFDQENEVSGRRGNYNELSEMKREFAEMKLLLKELIKKENELDAAAKQEEKGISGMFNGLMDMPEVKAAIVDQQDNPFRMAYVVDGEVGTIGGEPSLYKIQEVHDAIEKS